MTTESARPLNDADVAPDEAEMRRAAALFLCDRGVTEIRVLNADSRRTISGYFDNVDDLIVDVLNNIGDDVPAVYVTINPASPALHARAQNRSKRNAKVTTADEDILARRWLPVDLDPVRPSGISATDAEHDEALARSGLVVDDLLRLGFPAESIVRGDSGNGAHVLVRIDLPNDADATALIRSYLRALASLHNDAAVEIDQGVFNAGRILKLYGTVTGKGDSTADRPHRLARLLHVPETVVPAPRSTLETLAAYAPEPEERTRPGDTNGAGPHFDLAAWIARHGIDVLREDAYSGGTRYKLKACPFDPEHDRGSAALIQLESGALVFRCLHNHCVDKRWSDVRALYEPDRPQRQAGHRNGHGGATRGSKDAQRHTSDDSPSSGNSAAPSGNNTNTEQPWPELPPEARHGLVGEFVNLVEDTTEADPAALLEQFMVFFGNLIGRGPHFYVEDTRHSLNENALLVGDTAKARKGTSEGRVRRPFQHVDEVWVQARIAHGLSSGEGLIWAVRDEITKTEPIRENKQIVDYQEVVVDPGVEDKRLLVIEAEFASVLKVAKREGNTLSPLIRQAWDGGNLRTMTKNSPARSTNAHISIIGHITQAELHRHLDETEIANGLLNRFQLACVRRSKFLPEGGYVSDDDLRPFVERLREAIEFAKTTGEIVRDADARDLWAEVYPDLSEGRPGLLGAVTARAEAHVMRNAALFAVLDLQDTIAPPHLLAALAKWEFNAASALYLFGDRLGDPDADRVLDELRRRPEGMTRSEAYTVFKGHITATRLDRALALLIQRQKARTVTEATEGRSAERRFAV